MTADDWDNTAQRATWQYLHREPNSWESVMVVCQCQGPDKWVLLIERDDPIVLPSWQEVLDVTPMLIGLHKARKKHD